MPRNRGRGSGYEKFVASRLRRRGFRNIERNVMTRLGEIDIIASKHGRKYAFEVKDRPSKPITVKELEGFAEKARSVGAVPVLVASHRTRMVKKASLYAPRIKT